MGCGEKGGVREGDGGKDKGGGEREGERGRG